MEKFEVQFEARGKFHLYFWKSTHLIIYLIFIWFDKLTPWFGSWCNSSTHLGTTLGRGFKAPSDQIGPLLFQNNWSSLHTNCWNNWVVGQRFQSIVLIPQTHAFLGFCSHNVKSGFVDTHISLLQYFFRGSSPHTYSFIHSAETYWQYRVEDCAS